MRRRAIAEPDLPPQINIVSMIDVVFSILTFFIMSTLFLGRFEGLTVNLPKAESAKPQNTVRLTVTLNRTGQLYLNKSAIAVENLAAEIRQRHPSAKNLVIVLNADGLVTHDRVVGAIDQIRQVDGAKLAIATQRR